VYRALPQSRPVACPTGALVPLDHPNTPGCFTRSMDPLSDIRSPA
jgi:hypothetical protein